MGRSAYCCAPEAAATLTAVHALDPGGVLSATTPEAVFDARLWFIRNVFNQPDRTIHALKDELGVRTLELQFFNSFDEYLVWMAATTAPEIPSN
jgi:hypothetical protein